LFSSLSSGSYAYLYIYINNEGYCILASNTNLDGSAVISGSASLRLNEDDYVSIHFMCNDASYSVSGDTDFAQTWFSGHLVFENY
ncbi:MAG: hypothetical protein PVF73_02880, partial [Bacteroidales bacterium]